MMESWKEFVILALAIISALVIRRQAHEEGYRDGLKQLADRTEKAEQIYNSFVSYNIQRGERKEE